MKKLFVIDGYGQIYRSYYAFMQNPLTDKNGNNVSAVFGFFNTLITLIKHYKPDYIAVALDSKGKTFRHDLFPEYKANRAKTPEDLHAQIPVIESIMDACGIKHYSQQGMEADDIIATVSKVASQLNIETVIVTGDKDLLQLVNQNISALRPPRKGEHEYRLCKDAEVKELFGVMPDQIVDYLTILGDSSDNVPGIDGIGEKGAVKLLNEFGTLNNAYANIDSISGSVKTKLLAAKDHIELSKTLITLKDDLFDVSSVNLPEFETSSVNWEEAVKKFSELGSQRLVAAAKSMLPKDWVEKNTVNKTELTQVQKIADVNFENPNKLIGFDLKSKVKKLASEGITATPYFDISIAAWLLDSNSGKYTIEDLREKYSLEDNLSENEVVGILYPLFDSELRKNKLDKVFFELEMPLVKILSQMEQNGIMLVPEKLVQFETELKQQCSQIENDVYTLCGHEFNLNSPKQLQEVLFVERELPTGKKTSTGFSTDSDVLENLTYETEDPLPEMILKYRTLNKLLSVYTQPLVSLADSDKRVHTEFIQTGTATGRLSSKNPNLQNIPIRTDEGRKIRDAFCAKEGCVLLSADYSQIELAVLAHLSQDKSLCEAFIHGDDVHRQTASLIFDIFPEMVTPGQRRIAKTINFGVIYGMSAFRLAGDLKIPRKDAKSFIDKYFEKYNGVWKYIERIKKEAEQTKVVRTEMGHIRTVNEIASSNHNLKAYGERMAVNTVVQGTAAEIVKRAMISISKSLSEKKLQSALLLQVHDEVILEVPENELATVTKLVQDCMENAAKLTVPLRVGIESAKSWGLLH